MDAKTQSRARLTMHAIERHSRLLAESLDAALAELPPECVRWSAVCDPRRWLTPTLAPVDCQRESLRHEILDLASRYAAAAHDLESFIQNGAAGHDCEAKAAWREDLLSLAESLVSSLGQWLDGRESADDAPRAAPEAAPDAVPAGHAAPDLSP